MSDGETRIPIESDSVLLARVDERTERIETKLDNHLSHHWGVTLAIVVAFLGLVGAVIGAIILRVWTWFGGNA